MKKALRVLFLFAICFAFFTSARAEGDLPNGTRTCSGSCLIEPGSIEVKVSEETDSILAEFQKLFKTFFE